MSFHKGKATLITCLPDLLYQVFESKCDTFVKDFMNGNVRALIDMLLYQYNLGLKKTNISLINSICPNDFNIDGMRITYTDPFYSKETATSEMEEFPLLENKEEILEEYKKHSYDDVGKIENTNNLSYFFRVYFFFHNQLNLHFIDIKLSQLNNDISGVINKFYPDSNGLYIKQVRLLPLRYKTFIGSCNTAKPVYKNENFLEFPNQPKHSIGGVFNFNPMGPRTVENYREYSCLFNSCFASKNYADNGVEEQLKVQVDIPDIAFRSCYYDTIKKDNRLKGEHFKNVKDNKNEDPDDILKTMFLQFVKKNNVPKTSLKLGSYFFSPFKVPKCIFNILINSPRFVFFLYLANENPALFKFMISKITLSDSVFKRIYQKAVKTEEEEDEEDSQKTGEEDDSQKTEVESEEEIGGKRSINFEGDDKSTEKKSAKRIKTSESNDYALTIDEQLSLNYSDLIDYYCLNYIKFCKNHNPKVVPVIDAAKFFFKFDDFLNDYETMANENSVGPLSYIKSVIDYSVINSSLKELNLKLRSDGENLSVYCDLELLLKIQKTSGKSSVKANLINFFNLAIL